MYVNHLHKCTMRIDVVLYQRLIQSLCYLLILFGCFIPYFFVFIVYKHTLCCGFCRLGCLTKWYGYCELLTVVWWLTCVSILIIGYYVNSYRICNQIALFLLQLKLTYKLLKRIRNNVPSLTDLGQYYRHGQNLLQKRVIPNKNKKEQPKPDKVQLA